MQVELNHIGKYLESKESERDEATYNFFEIKKRKKEFEMRESSRLLTSVEEILVRS